MNYPNFSEEKKLWRKGYEFVIGLDEAGRGPLAGPVVAAGVIVSQFQISNFKFQINDSKKLNARKREETYDLLTNHPNIQYGVGVVSEKIIDQINILEATKLAMQKAISNLSYKSHGREICKTVDFLLIDGNFSIQIAQSLPSANIIRMRPSEFENIPYKSIVKGDQKVFSISAASIIAKVTRDRIMKQMHETYPKYGFNQHKGYATRMHVENLKNFGPCKIHRKTFFLVSVYK
ncbi:MAG: ribonuclease HII [Candidatus Staskawiczbacteria bacterium RIFCSPLOWO2_01_FULL_40_39]|uniref:Ribonuclease HII n=1 Tax=Candidatus Staskawiczbacteria bacterium RIFCSPHIGHO2_01_FULL_39_25 TaxID=1802202 RepID=A0A1G2HQ47_9BACT|nr:MAG: ribonuclease HII [Candidatus Staskawiczbacteria bacterium RIFCSPHIGHO2_01_FULL_39_25]OGZ72858.1 MAG: ribonuclease HII [Candidatus Staskawiczbacteria bacterium RIFCSPLOWO2_01_FULL_40_39]OGZ75217.1 MAG: ribonuclease HII [Candidatus Staskawiczbacteria bacterium RIFCSPLOWO2_02_FULL_39_8]